MSDGFRPPRWIKQTKERLASLPAIMQSNSRADSVTLDRGFLSSSSHYPPFSGISTPADNSMLDMSDETIWDVIILLLLLLLLYICLFFCCCCHRHFYPYSSYLLTPHPHPHPTPPRHLILFLLVFFRPDITVMADWALNTSYLAIFFLLSSYVPLQLTGCENPFINSPPPPPPPHPSSLSFSFLFCFCLFCFVFVFFVPFLSFLFCFFVLFACCALLLLFNIFCVFLLFLLLFVFGVCLSEWGRGWCCFFFGGGGGGGVTSEDKTTEI